MTDGRPLTPLADGFDTTVVLDCGCEIRLNSENAVVPFSVDDWWRCSQHSQRYAYDPDSGEPLMERDRRALEVRDES